jgi:uncharacterized membrane protein
MMWGGGVFALICIAVMIWMMLGHGMMGHGGSSHEEKDGPERTLANRLAKGEINIEEYQRLLEELRRTDSFTHA